MAVTLTRISNSQTFGTWLQRTNDLVDSMSGNVVTTDASPGGAVTTGNAYVNGFLGSITVWAGNSVANTGANSTAIFTTWGFTANASGLSSNALIANAFNIASGIVIGNSSGFYTNSVTCNVLAVSTSLHVNSSAVNVATLTASANVIANNAQLTTQLNVGSAMLTTSALTIGTAILSSGNVVLNGGSPNAFFGNSSGNTTIRAVEINSSYGFGANVSGVYGNNFVCNSSGTIQIGAGHVANSTALVVGNTTINTGTVFVGNASINTVINSSAISTSWGVSGNTTSLYANNLLSNVVTVNTSITVGTTSHNTTAIVVGNSILTTTNLSMGTGTVTGTVNVNIANSTGNISISPTGFTTSWALSANTTALYTNAHVTNTIAINTVATGNSSGLFAANLTSNLITIGTSVVNTTTVTAANVVATNLYVNAISTNTLALTNALSIPAITLGNSTVNCSVNSTVFFFGNSSYFNLYANTTGAYTNGSLTVTGNLYVSGNTISSGTTVGTGDYIPSVNTYALGNTTNRWIIWAMSANLVGNLSMTTNTCTISIGNASVNATVNSTVYSGTANNTSYVGAVTAVNVVSNAQLSGNLGLYTNTLNLNTTLGTYLLLSGVTTNVAGVLPTYGGALYVNNTVSIGNSGTNSTINSTFFSQTSNNANFIGGLPAANVVSNAILQANLGNYTTSTQLTNNLANYTTATQLTNNLANYQTTGATVATVYGALPNYTGVLNASTLAILTSFSLGNTSVNISSNSTIMKWSNSSVVFSLGAPTSVQVANGQYYYDSAGAWTTLPTQYGNVLTTGTATQNIDSWAMSSFYGAEYLIDVGDNNANNRTLTKILLTHDSNNSFVTEYATIITNSSMGVFESTSNATQVTLNFTPVSTNTTVRWAKTII